MPALHGVKNSGFPPFGRPGILPGRKGAIRVSKCKTIYETLQIDSPGGVSSQGEKTTAPTLFLSPTPGFCLVILFRRNRERFRLEALHLQGLRIPPGLPEVELHLLAQPAFRIPAKCPGKAYRHLRGMPE